MELYFKGAAGILLAAVLGLALQKQEKDLSAVLTAAVIAMAAVLMLRLLEPVLELGVLELPLPFALSSAERFADGGVQALMTTGLVTHLAFGSECGEKTRVEALFHAGGQQSQYPRCRFRGGHECGDGIEARRNP